MTSLLGGVAACRLCGVPGDLGVVLANKSVSSPFALAGAAALGKRERERGGGGGGGGAGVVGIATKRQ